MPFTSEDFSRLFAAYNLDIWPIQILALAIGAVATLALCTRRASSVRVAFGLLAALWAWTGIVYHMAYFVTINPTAYVFGWGFVIEAGLLLAVAVRSGPSVLRSSFDAATVAGWILLVYGLVVYPAATLLWTHPYPRTPMFGVTPCPTVIYTFGLLLLVKPSLPRWLFVVPALWAVIGGSAAVFLDVPEDWMLFAALVARLAIREPAPAATP